ncbi:MAG: hypothetical protein ACRBDL_05665 [Alphaproteobacteria bacterium]
MYENTANKISSLLQQFKTRMQAPSIWEDADNVYEAAKQGKLIDPKTMKVESTFDPDTDEGQSIIDQTKKRLDDADKVMASVFTPDALEL